MKIAKRVLVPGKLRDKPGTNGTKPGTRLVPTKVVGQDITKREGYQVAETLTKLLNSNDIPASARVIAARTLAEIEGLIGRHQAAPERSGAALATLSRAELVAELERLRSLIGMGLIS
jgi:hypothetical protein